MRTKAKYIQELLQTEDEHLKKLNEIVLQSIEQEKLVLQNLAVEEAENLSLGQRTADKVARFGGSWKFIIWFGGVLLVWILINFLLPAKERWDPFPFILLNLLLSCLAAIQAPIIMMSQNRQEEKDRHRNENDYIVNLKAEIEIKTLHQKMDLLIQEQAEQIKVMQAMLRERKH